jgi:hypothetical protein
MKIYDKKTLMVLVHIGEAKADGDEHGYKLSHTLSGGPHVQSEKTGKAFVLSWQDIIELAVKEGVDND